MSAPSAVSVGEAEKVVDVTKAPVVLPPLTDLEGLKTKKPEEILEEWRKERAMLTFAVHTMVAQTEMTQEKAKSKDAMIQSKEDIIKTKDQMIEALNKSAEEWHKDKERIIQDKEKWLQDKEELRIRMVTDLMAKLAETTMVLANRSTLEKLCLQYVIDYRRTLSPDAEPTDKERRSTSTWDAYKFVSGRVAPNNQMNHEAYEDLKSLVTEAKAIGDKKMVEGSLATLWDHLSTDVHNFKFDKVHGMCIGNRYPERAALALVVLRAQRDGKLTEAFFYGEGTVITAKLEGGRVVPGKLEKGEFVPDA